MFPSQNSFQRASGSLKPPGGPGPLSVAAQQRRKVILQPGHSPLDWANLSNSGKDLRGISSSDFPLKVDKSLLQKHNKIDDCWMNISGKVYNITPYVKFHPGGVEEIMKGAGRDGTALFRKYHNWVNVDKMLENCLVGLYVG